MNSRIAGPPGSGEWSVEVREARNADAAAVAPLLAELGFPTPLPTITERIDSMIGAGELVLVASLEGNLVGLVTAHATPVLHRPTPVGRLTALVVGERARGLGVGRALVAAAEAALAARQCALVEVTSNKRLTAAHAFYERMGYEATSIRFWKSLAPREP